MPIETYLKAWLESDKSLPERMCTAYMQKGGWEIWAQVEFGAFLTKNNFYKSVEREVGVFNSSGARADLLCSADVKKQTYDYDIVELKTETLFQSGGGKDDFLKRVEGEIPKFDGLQSSFTAKNTRATVVGISVAAQTTKDVMVAWGTKMNTISVYVKDAWWIAAFYTTKKPA